MIEIFKKHITKFAQISDDEFEGIKIFFDIKEINKKENLLEEGQICKNHYFVLKGLLRKFYVNEKGSEQTTEFAIETWWLTDNFAYENQIPTEFYIQAIEKSTILFITLEKQKKMLEQFPVMERYFRFVYQRAYAAAQKRIKFLFSFSKEEFYFQALRNHQEFVQRVPQYLIASYLGFTPEYLSEIRKKLLS